MTLLSAAILAALEADLPCEPRPFKALAERYGVGEGELIAAIQAGLADGRIRRYGARVRHHQMGFAANAMVVWQVPQDKLDEVGPEMAAHRAVSHCYERPTFDGFPYNVYTMIHGRSEEECEATIGEIAEATGIREYHALYTTREFKKTAPQYADRE